MKLEEHYGITLTNVLNRYNALDVEEIEEIEEYLVISIYSAS